MRLTLTTSATRIYFYMYGLHEFIPSGSFITGNPVPYNTDIRDLTSIHTDKNDVVINFGEPKVHIVTKTSEEARSVVNNIFKSIATDKTN